MNAPIPVRSILLEDAISRNKNGISILRERQEFSYKLLSSKHIRDVFAISFLVSVYYAVNKRYTNRKVYFVSTIASFAVSFLSHHYYTNMLSKAPQELKCENEYVREYAKFYKNSILDLVNYYEK